MIIAKEVDNIVRKGHHAQVNCVLIWQDGRLLSQNYYNRFTPESRNVIRSIAKSIVSLGIGIALEEGLIHSLDDPIGRYIPEFSQNRDWKHKLITIRHLLTMNSGIFWNGGIHYHCPMMTQLKLSNDWIDYIADCAVKNMPGSVHNYSEWDMILATQILQNVTKDAYDYINQNLYLPLGIKSDRWYQSPCGVYYSVALDEELEKSSNLTGLELLQIGILALQNGIWNGKRIVSDEYMREAVRPSPQDKGYGYFWWIGDGWYGCKGYGGQSITVFPEKKKVIVTQATPTARGMSYDDVIRECDGLS